MPDVANILRRLGTMSRGELAERARQEFWKRWDWARYRAGVSQKDTVRTGISGPGSEFFFRPEQVDEIVALLRQRTPQQSTFIETRAHQICEHKLDLLGYKVDLGSDIDWHLDYVHRLRAPLKPWFKIDYLDFKTVGDSKITWELNRHQHLVTLAKAYRLTGKERFAVELFNQWYDWREKNPYPIGINWASSLEVAFRAISWLWIAALVRGKSAAADKLDHDLSAMLSISGRHLERYLSTYFSPNTHLIGEAVALFFIGVLRPELKQAAQWKRKGWDIVVREMERQVLSDGVYFEQSVYYHVYALDFFLHAGLLAARNGIDVPAGYSRKVEQMLEALMWLGQSGVAPRFGDDDGGRLFDPARNSTEHLLDPLSTGAIAYGRADFKAVANGIKEETLWLMGAEGVAQWDQLGAQAPPATSIGFADAGWYVMAQGTKSRASLVLDAGPHGSGNAGHGHADALNLQLFMDGECLLLDPGTGEYVGDGQERAVYRTSAAHNTLVVDGRSQAEPRGPFAWIRKYNARAERWIQGEEFSYLRGTHDGYQDLPSPVTHRRTVFHRRPYFWLIFDRVEGTSPHTLTVSWHLGPTLRRMGDETLFLNRERNCGVGLLTSAGSQWSREFARESWSPAYGRYEPASVLKYHRQAALPCDFATLILPIDERTEVGKFTESAESNAAVHALRYANREEEHLLFAAHSTAVWESGQWRSDAEVLYCHLDHNGIRNLTACQGSFVEFAGKRVLESEGPSPHCELLREGKEFRLCHAEDARWTFDQAALGVRNEPAMAGSTGVKE